MGAFTSERFASAAAAGSDWREAARAVLTELETALRSGEPFTLGFLYITDALSANAASILELVRSVTQVEHWVGMATQGVCGVGESFVDRPAIAVLLARFKPDEICVSPACDLDTAAADRALDAWLERHDPMLVLVHGAPAAGSDPAAAIRGIEHRTGGFITGGLSSARRGAVQFADGVEAAGLSGVAFSQEIEVATALTQGCAPLGGVHRITRCEENVILELDGRRAFDVFAEDLKSLAPADEAGGEAVQTLYRGEVHVAFPVAGADTRDYLVRNALGADRDKGTLTVAQAVRHGEEILFVHRDGGTARADLLRMLMEMRARVTREQGEFRPAGALYISCVSRAAGGFGDANELGLIREIIGDVPLAGFYAGGEISSGRVYGHTGVLILFL